MGRTRKQSSLLCRGGSLASSPFCLTWSHGGERRVEQGKDRAILTASVACASGEPLGCLEGD